MFLCAHRITVRQPLWKSAAPAVHEQCRGRQAPGYVRAARLWPRATRSKRSDRRALQMTGHLTCSTAVNWSLYRLLPSSWLAEEAASGPDKSLFFRVVVGGVAIVFFGILFTTITARIASEAEKDPESRALFDEVLDSSRERRPKRKRPDSRTAPPRAPGSKPEQD